MAVSFSTTKEEAKLIGKIAARAANLAKAQGGEIDYVDTEMDVTACHANGCPLDLQKLLHFDDANFLHDICGIGRHLDRDSGKLLWCFLPRSAVPKE